LRAWPRDSGRGKALGRDLFSGFGDKAVQPDHDHPPPRKLAHQESLGQLLLGPQPESASPPHQGGTGSGVSSGHGGRREGSSSAWSQRGDPLALAASAQGNVGASSPWNYSGKFQRQEGNLAAVLQAEGHAPAHWPAQGGPRYSPPPSPLPQGPATGHQLQPTAVRESLGSDSSNHDGDVDVGVMWAPLDEGNLECPRDIEVFSSNPLPLTPAPPLEEIQRPGSFMGFDLAPFGVKDMESPLAFGVPGSSPPLTSVASPLAQAPALALDPASGPAPAPVPAQWPPGHNDVQTPGPPPVWQDHWSSGMNNTMGVSTGGVAGAEAGPRVGAGAAGEGGTGDCPEKQPGVEGGKGFPSAPPARPAWGSTQPLDTGYAAAYPWANMSGGYPGQGLPETAPKGFTKQQRPYSDGKVLVRQLWLRQEQERF
ncbi:unnamed protein product, partial [Discosporangium mesarthrocarpum]